MPRGVGYLLYKLKVTSLQGAVLQAANVQGGNKARFIMSQGGRVQVTHSFGRQVGSGEAILPAVTWTSHWSSVRGEHHEEQKLRAEALQDQDAVSPAEAGLKY